MKKSTMLIMLFVLVMSLFVAGCSTSTDVGVDSNAESEQSQSNLSGEEVSQEMTIDESDDVEIGEMV